jgi:S1-C subfamily serine protease
MTPLVALTLILLAQEPAASPPGRPPTAPAPADVVASIESALADAIAKAEASVVAIHRDKGPNPNETLAVRGRGKPTPPFPERDRFEFPRHLPMDDDFVSFDYGSGVVIGDRGEILTAFHVVRGASRLLVRAAGGQSFRAELIAADPRSDLAVLVPVQDREGERPRLKPIAIGDATGLRKGSFLVAVGNPFNAAREDGSPSATWGILSNRARRLDVESDGFSSAPRRTLQEYPTLLQLDSKLNLGMSGGAVINLKGELVGITTTASSPAGFDVQAGYAIPMDRMGRRAVEALKQGKEVEYGVLGIYADQQFTNRVSRVVPHSPAALGHLQINDEILAVNGVPVSNFDSLILSVSVYAPGEPVRLKIRRSDEIIERTIVLAKYHVDGEVIATNRPRPWRGLRVDYTTTIQGKGLGAPDTDSIPAGVVVTEVEEGSAAAAAGLKKGVVIFRVGDRPIQNPRDFAAAVADKEGSVPMAISLGPDADISMVSVGTEESSRTKPAEPPRRSR